MERELPGEKPLRAEQRTNKPDPRMELNPKHIDGRLVLLIATPALGLFFVELRAL